VAVALVEQPIIASFENERDCREWQMEPNNIIVDGAGRENALSNVLRNALFELNDLTNGLIIYPRCYCLLECTVCINVFALLCPLLLLVEVAPIFIGSFFPCLHQEFFKKNVRYNIIYTNDILCN